MDGTCWNVGKKAVFQVMHDVKKEKYYLQINKFNGKRMLKTGEILLPIEYAYATGSLLCSFHLKYGNPSQDNNESIQQLMSNSKMSQVPINLTLPKEKLELLKDAATDQNTTQEKESTVATPDQTPPKDNVSDNISTSSTDQTAKLPIKTDSPEVDTSTKSVKLQCDCGANHVGLGRYTSK